MTYRQFYLENKQEIDTHLIPLLSPGNSRIVGGRHKIMYQQWAWNLAVKIQESGCLGFLITRRPIYIQHNDDLGVWKEWDYARMEFVFSLLGKLIIKKSDIRI